MEILKILILLLLAVQIEGHLLAECCLHEGDGCYLGGDIVHCSGVQQLIELKKCFDSNEERGQHSHRHLELNFKVNEPIPSDLFEGLLLRKLIIRLEENEILPNTSFSGLKTLRRLELIAVNGLQESDLTPFEYLNITSMRLRGYNFEERWDSLDLLFPVLEELDVSYNNIERTKPLFTSLQRKPIPLKVLNLKGNKISSISSPALPRLTEVNLADNMFSSLKSLAYFPKIKKLLLRGNKVSEVSSELIEKFQNLEYLDLSRNSLKTVKVNVFPKSLKKIYLNNNQINHVDDDAFEEMTDLEEVNLANNNLSSLNLAALNPAKLPNLKVLHLAYNPWTCSCLSFELIQELKKRQAENVTVTWPHCINHSEEEFKNCNFTEKTTLLSIANKTIYCVTCDELPKGCDVKGSRSVVDCSSAVLGKLSSLPKVLPEVVTELRMDHNNVRNLIGLALPIYRNLFKLSVSHNLLESLDYLPDVSGTNDDWMKVKTPCKYLNAAHNRILNFTWKDSRLWFGLEFLDLSHNRMSYIDLKDFYYFTDLVTLNLSSNRLHQLPTKFFSYFVSLRTFEVSNNTLTRFPATLRYAIRLIKLVIADNQFQNMSSFGRRKGDTTEVTLPSDIEVIEMHGNKFDNLSEVCSLLRRAKLYLLQKVTLGGSNYNFGNCDQLRNTKTCLGNLANITDRKKIRNRNNQTIDYMLELQKMRCSDSNMVGVLIIVLIVILLIFLVCCVIQKRHFKMLPQILMNLWPTSRYPPRKIMVCHMEDSLYSTIKFLVSKYANAVETFDDLVHRSLGKAKVEIYHDGFTHCDAVIIILREQFVRNNDCMYILSKAVHHNIHRDIKLAIILPKSVCINDLAVHVDWLKLDFFNHLILKENCLCFDSLLKSYLCRRSEKSIKTEDQFSTEVEEDQKELDEKLESLMQRLSQELNEIENNLDRDNISLSSEDVFHDNRAFSMSMESLDEQSETESFENNKDNG